MNELFTSLALELGFEPPSPVCFSSSPVTTKSRQENDYLPEVQCQLSTQSEEIALSERREHCFKQKTIRTNPRKKCRMQTTRKKKKGRKTLKKRSRCITRSFVIICNPDWKECVVSDSFSGSNVSHPEGETQSCDHDRD